MLDIHKVTMEEALLQELLPSLKVTLTYLLSAQTQKNQVMSHVTLILLAEVVSTSLNDPQVFFYKGKNPLKQVFEFSFCA